MVVSTVEYLIPTYILGEVVGMPHWDGGRRDANTRNPVKGMCNNCGEYGHKAAWCPEKQGEAQHFLHNGKCWFCSSEEHELFECDKFAAAKARKLER